MSSIKPPTQFVKWDDFKKKDLIFHMLQTIGQELVIVYQDPKYKNGLASALKAFNRHNLVTIEITSTSAHVCTIQLKGLY